MTTNPGLALLFLPLLCAAFDNADYELNSDFDPDTVPYAEVVPENTTHCVCLAGVADCSNLDLVDFRERQLCDRSVTALDLSQNQLSTFPQVPDHLQLVNASLNQISSVRSVQGLQLTQLDLSWNELTTSAAQPLRQLASLQLLNVSHNQLEELTFLPELCALRELDAAGNTVSDLGSALTCNLLERLQLENNELVELPDAAWPSSLRVLNLASNQITHLLNVSFPLALEDLDVSDNLLEFVSLNLELLVNLRRLNLSNNMLDDLFFTSWPVGLEEIDLSENLLEALPPGLEQLPRLRVLDVSENHLTQLPGPGTWPALVRLSLFANEVREPDYDRLQALLGRERGRDRSVDLRGNQLQPGPGLVQLLKQASSWKLQDGDVCCGSLNLGNSSLQLCLAAGCDRSTNWAESLRNFATTTTTTTTTTPTTTSTTTKTTPTTTTSTTTTTPTTRRTKTSRTTTTPLPRAHPPFPVPGSDSEGGKQDWPSEVTYSGRKNTSTPGPVLNPEPPTHPPPWVTLPSPTVDPPGGGDDVGNSSGGVFKASTRVLLLAMGSVVAATLLVVGLVCLHRRHRRRSSSWRVVQPGRDAEMSPLTRSASRAAPRAVAPPTDTPRSLRVADERFLA